MQADPLQQLRDIHLPQVPGWWPPAPGWWLVALLTVALMCYVGIRWRRYRKRREPVRYAQHYYQQLQKRYASGELDATTYVQQTNELLKRLLIHAAPVNDAARASNTQWLQLLDNIADNTQFSHGPGQVLGNARFAPQLQLDDAAFDQLIQQFLKGLRV